MVKYLLAFLAVLIVYWGWLQAFSSRPVHAEEEMQQLASVIESESRVEKRAMGGEAPRAEKKYTPAKVAKFKACLKDGVCEEEGEDPRAATHHAAEELEEYLQLLKEEHESPDYDGRPMLDIALDLIQIDHERVKAAALDLLQTEPAELRVLPILFTSFENEPNGELVSRLLPESKRYPNQQAQNQWDQFFSQMLSQGPHFSSLEVAKKLNLILTKSNYNTYNQLLSKLSPKTEVYRWVHFHLSEFWRLHNGA